MRSDSTLPADDFSRSQAWQTDPFTQQSRPAIDRRYSAGSEEQDQQTRWHSFSGRERNRLFINHQGARYDDRSALSGLDNIADGRAWARWDFDRDGWTDVVLCNANYPLLNLYRNLQGSGDSTFGRRHFLAVQLVGGNRSAEAALELSNRDAVGARVAVQAGSLTMTQHQQRGEGFAAQNSATLLFGLADQEYAERLRVIWPSGRTTEMHDVPADRWVWCYETADVAPNSQLFELRSYTSSVPIAARAGTAQADGDRLPLDRLIPRQAVGQPPELYLLTTTATWCEACHRLQPQLRRVAERFGGRVALYGVPVDPIETPAELAAFAQRTQPAYSMLSEISADLRDEVVGLLRRLLNTESIPCTLVVDREGVVVQAFLGVPTVSDVGRWLPR